MAEKHTSWEVVVIRSLGVVLMIRVWRRSIDCALLVRVRLIDG